MCVFNKRDPATTVSVINSIHAVEPKNKTFGVENNDLIELMKLRSIDGVNELNNKYGGIDGLASRLNTDLVSGLSGDTKDLNTRIDNFGKNEIPVKSSKSFFALMIHALQETTLIILIVCALVSIGLSFYHPPDEEKSEDAANTEETNLEWIEGIAILIAVIVVVVVTAFNDWRKEKQFRSLQNRIEKDNLTSVIRNGQIIRINIKEIVVGDVVCVKYGDSVPSDGVVINSSDLKVDESSLTGETDLVKKNEYDVLLLAGTNIMEGSGVYLVTAVGLNSQTGIIFKLLGATKEEKRKKDKKKKNDSPTDSFEKTKISSGKTVLQMKLKNLSIKIGYIGISAAFLTFCILCTRLAIEEFYIKKNVWSNTYIKYITSFLVQAVTVVVVAVPEGLPLAVTLSLAFAVRKMTLDNNLVRHLNACETMGSATTICSDKTGTLTTNRMTVVECFFGDELLKKVPTKEHLSFEFKELMFEAISINTNYTSKIEMPKLPGELPQQLGNKTECGLIGLVNELGGDYAQIRSTHPTESLVKVYTFNSARKMMTTIVKVSENGVYRLYTKGAPEIILDKCSFMLNSKMFINSLNQVKRNKVIKNIIETMGSNGLRTICIAYRDFVPKSLKPKDVTAPPNIEYYDEIPDWNNEIALVNYMTSICILGIEDPVRIEVPDAIKKCQSSGIVVRMITGDNINTATSIALKCGIIKPSDDFLVIDSKEFNRRIRDSNNKVSQELLDKVWPRLRVLARSSPQDKYTLVNGIVESKLSANREVVAVTGDGTNDGPALKRADVGFSMGIQGTDVAKEASDIILTDDNFNSIVKAVLWGRNVYDSIAKFLQFQLTANFCAGLLSIICAATIQAVPLKAVQMLWVNLVMDTLASLALGTEKPDEALLKRKPYGRTKSMVSFEMCKFIVLHTIYQLVVICVLVYFAEKWLLIDDVTKYDDISKLKAPSQHFTLIFNAFVLMTLFNEINARKLNGEQNVFEGIHKNPYFYVIWVICFSGQILIVNFGGIAFSVEPLELDHWAWCLLFGVGTLLWGQIVSSIPSSFLKRIFLKKKKNQEILELQIMESLSVSQIDPGEEEIVANFMYDEDFKTSGISAISGINDIKIMRF